MILIDLTKKKPLWFFHSPKHIFGRNHQKKQEKKNRGQIVCVQVVRINRNVLLYIRLKISEALGKTIKFTFFFCCCFGFETCTGNQVPWLDSNGEHEQSRTPSVTVDDVTVTMSCYDVHSIQNPSDNKYATNSEMNESTEQVSACVRVGCFELDGLFVLSVLSRTHCNFTSSLVCFFLGKCYITRIENKPSNTHWSFHSGAIDGECMYACVCVCVWVRKKERVSVSVWVCVRLYGKHNWRPGWMSALSRTRKMCNMHGSIVQRL